MKHHVVKIGLESGASEELQKFIDDYNADVVSTSVYVDIMQPTALPMLVVVLKERQGADVPLTEVAPRLKVQGADPDSDPVLFAKWVAGGLDEAERFTGNDEDFIYDGAAS